ncbi:hypothetical protein [Streptomyces sp. UNOB3_S3]|uniref:hypothetical protein n=1 Tax=Streptomyces sp. UNOB3_S3 TaxID=2871682 RepID=UPI0035AEB25B
MPGLTARTLRHYEEIGISTGRRCGTSRSRPGQSGGKPWRGHRRGLPVGPVGPRADWTGNSSEGSRT